MLQRVCSYCETELGEALDPALVTAVSHGICRNCLERELIGCGDALDSFLDSLAVPIFVVNGQGHILMANDMAQAAVEKEAVEVVGYLGGEVFGCPYAGLPGGCGQTLHCQSCTIRLTVNRTYETGQPCHKVEACQDLDTLDGVRQVHFFISTQKRHDVVLLQIDEMFVPQN